MERLNSLLSRWGLGLLAAGLVGCATASHLNLDDVPGFRALPVEDVLHENPLREGENIRVVSLGRHQAMSQHLVQIRDREAPHLHAHHDLTVFMLRAKGYLVLNGRRVNLRTSDVLTIRRGSPHYYVNEDSRAAVVFAVYAPAFDGKDIVPVRE
jgi:quercetin dioxygenase-like cupin family protein